MPRLQLRDNLRVIITGSIDENDTEVIGVTTPSIEALYSFARFLMTNTETEFSVVIPVYNSERTLDELVHRISATFTDLRSSFEIILVNDGSHDDSWSVMKRLREGRSNIKIIHLARNFGQHNATLCGFRYAQGRYVIVIDDDLQQPPEEIPKLIKKIEQGYAVVYGAYEQKRHGFIENVLSSIFQKLMHSVLHIPSSIFISSFMICTSDVIRNAVTTRTAFPFLPALTVRNTSVDNVANVYVEHLERETGESNYSVLRWLGLLFDLVINYSSLPLAVVAGVGIIASCVSLTYGLYIIIEFIRNPSYGLLGWNSLMVATTMLGGLTLTAMAVVGEYLRRIIAEISYEQQYIVAEENI